MSDHDGTDGVRADGRRRTNALLAVIALILAGLVLRSLASVFIPVVLCVFITLVSLPLLHGVTRVMPHGLRWMGILAVMLVLLLCLLLFVGGLAYCVQQIAAKMPEVSEQLGSVLPRPSEMNGDMHPVIRDALNFIDGPSGSISSTLLEQATGMAQTIANGTGLVITGTIIVLFLVLLALSEVDTWGGKLDTLSDSGEWKRIVGTLSATLRQFIAVRTFIGVITAIAYSAILYAFDVDLLLVWAILAFLLTFVPNLGSLISGILPTLYAFLTLDFATAMVVGTGLFVIEQIIGNFLDPRLQGQRVALSPLVILIAILLWSAIWGVAGAFLGTPVTIAIMILCNSIAPLRPVALLLSNQTKPSDLDRALGWEEAGSTERV